MNGISKYIKECFKFYNKNDLSEKRNVYDTYAYMLISENNLKSILKRVS